VQPRHANTYGFPQHETAIGNPLLMKLPRFEEATLKPCRPVCADGTGRYALSQ
jgi:hypothetical protein